MLNPTEFIKKLGNGERYQSLSIILIIGVMVWYCGCTSKVTSILSPDTKVSREELNIEIDTFLATAENRLQKLDKQDEIKRLIANQADIIAKGGAINPLGIMALCGSVFGIGATVDNIRKRKVIKRLENGETA